MNGNQRLELTWIGKEKRPRLEPRILLEDADRSYHAAQRVHDHDVFDNKLIHGDNLLALRALEGEFAGQVKCIYIDPPFNTGEAFEHYDDGVEHSIWLTLLRDRLALLHNLLRSDGSIFVHIDDAELGYLICLMDEIFGRRNRINVISFKQSSASGPKAINPGLVTTTNYVVYYCKAKDEWRPNRVFVRRERDDRYSMFIENRSSPPAQWIFRPLREAFAEFDPPRGNRQVSAAAEERRLEKFVLSNADAVARFARIDAADVTAAARDVLRESETSESVLPMERDGKDTQYFYKGQQVIFYSAKTRKIDGEYVTAEPATNLWDDLLSNNVHKEGGVRFPNGKKPEGLIKRVLEIATEPGDLVLDSFAGSGTTAAVAHKMGRKWIAIEQREQAETHILPRLRRVVDGADPDGVTSAVGWEGGGGFRFYRLAPSMLEADAFGNWIISKKYNAAMLAEAMCKHMGFTYAPSEIDYWRHGYSSERDFIYVTTQSLTHDQFKRLSDDVGEDRTLLICCKAFKARTEAFHNLTVKKIPLSVLSKCEWGCDDYSLGVAALETSDASGMLASEVQEPQRKKRGSRKVQTTADLFDEENGTDA